MQVHNCLILDSILPAVENAQTVVVHLKVLLSHTSYHKCTIRSFVFPWQLSLWNQRHPDMLTLKDAGIEISTPATITRASLRQGITFHNHDHGHHHYNHLKYHHDQNDRPHLLMVRSLSPTHTTADSSPQFVQICQKFLLLCGPNFLFHRGVTTKSQISQIL